MKEYIKFDWDKLLVERVAIPGFDPEKPFLDEEKPNWKEEPEIKSKLANYFAMKETILYHSENQDYQGHEGHQ